MPTSSSFSGRKRNTYKKIRNVTAETPLVLKELPNLINVFVSVLKIIIIIIIIINIIIIIIIIIISIFHGEESFLRS
jgi:hypothetical protein